MIKANIQVHFRSRIKKGCYLYDVILQVLSDSSMEEITLGTIVTQTNQAGEILSRYRFSEVLFNWFNLKKEEQINDWCNTAVEDTKQLNDFFATNL